MTRQERCRLRFMRLLCRAGTGSRAEDGSYGVEHAGIRAQLEAGSVTRLASAGALTLNKQGCRANAESRAWLRRHLSHTQEFSSQHRTETVMATGTRRNRAATPLLQLAGAGRERGFLEPHQLAAAERACLWAERACLRQRVTMSYTGTHTAGKGNKAPGGQELGDMALDARKNLASLFELLPRDCAEIIVDVCVFEKGLQTIETERGWPRRSAKLVLRIGLEQLAQKLGLGPRAEGREKGALLTWLDEGARPHRFE